MKLMVPFPNSNEQNKKEKREFGNKIEICKDAQGNRQEDRG